MEIGNEDSIVVRMTFILLKSTPVFISDLRIAAADLLAQCRKNATLDFMLEVARKQRLAEMPMPTEVKTKDDSQKEEDEAKKADAETEERKAAEELQRKHDEDQKREDEKRKAADDLQRKRDEDKTREDEERNAGDNRETCVEYDDKQQKVLHEDKGEQKTAVAVAEVTASDAEAMAT